MPEMKEERILILDNIRSTHNVGAIFRTADAVGIEKIYLAGITPAPIDRFGRVRADIAKSALGAEKSVGWEQVKSTALLIKKLKKLKYQIIAIEQSPKAIDYKSIVSKEKCAVVMGNEVDGISEAVLKLCTTVAEIPMHGEKESLNVSVAAGIALYRIFDQ